MSETWPTTFLLCVLSWASAGCNPRCDLVGDHDPGQPLVISLGGVGGETIGTDLLRAGLEDALIDCRVVAWRWSRGLRGLYLCDLWDVEDNRRRAGELAAAIEEFRAACPAVPVVLVGHSGGTAIAVFALEALSAGVQVDEAVLLAPAFSSEYNLAPALRHVHGRLLSTCSGADTVILGAGTRVFGTMDRRYEPAAGRDGLRVPEGLSAEDRQEYRKVYEARWSWTWLARAHYGGHFGWSTPWFAKRYIAPVVMGGDVPGIFRPLARGEGAS